MGRERGKVRQSGFVVALARRRTVHFIRDDHLVLLLLVVRVDAGVQLLDAPLVARVFGVEEFFVAQVGVVGFFGIVQRVDDHMVVEHLGLVGAVDGVELVLFPGLGVRSELVSAHTSLRAPQVQRREDDHERDQGGEGSRQGHLTIVLFRTTSEALIR